MKILLCPEAIKTEIMNSRKTGKILEKNRQL